MRFCVVGLGFVGNAIFSVLSDKHKVEIIDPDHGVQYNDISDVKDIVSQVHGFIICVPTPQADNGRVDDTLVSDYVSEIQKHHPDAHILIKSTTSVDTLHNFRGLRQVTFSPEFLSSETSVDTTKQFRDVKFAIYGGKGGRWWHEIFKQLQYIQEVRFLDIASAGFLKYTENAFLAMKVMFFNEINHLYDTTVDINYDSMVEALALDKRIGMSHTQVPGPDGKHGYGGHCLPKDTSEFVTWADENFANLHLLELTRKLNIEKYRK